MKNDKKIKIISVGGAGVNMILRIHKEGIEGVELIRMDTSYGSIAYHDIGRGIELGKKLIKGYHTAGDLKLGMAAAEESIDEIASVFSGADIVIIVCGLGGGVGSGSTPVIAKKAREAGIYTVCVATLPFQFEGSKRNENADIGRETIKENSDVLILLEHNCLASIEHPRNMLDALKESDGVISKIVDCIARLELSDFANHRLTGDKVVENIRSCSQLKNYDIDIVRQDTDGVGC